MDLETASWVSGLQHCHVAVLENLVTSATFMQVPA